LRQNFFEKYSTYGKHKGTGLGTYSAKLIVETLKGTINLDTSVQSMTSIHVTLPLAI
jgi:signal transduction histidine kinase